MIDNDKRRSNQQAKEKVRRRIRVQIDPDNYEYEPERKPIDYNNDEAHSRVAIYVRVSTDDVRQLIRPDRMVNMLTGTDSFGKDLIVAVKAFLVEGDTFSAFMEQLFIFLLSSLCCILSPDIDASCFALELTTVTDVRSF